MNSLYYLNNSYNCLFIVLIMISFLLIKIYYNWVCLFTGCLILNTFLILSQYNKLNSDLLYRVKYL